MNTDVLILIPNNHRDPELTNVQLNPNTGEILFDGPVRITDCIVHPHDINEQVTDYSYALSPDEFFTRIKPSPTATGAQYAYFRGRYFRLAESGHEPVTPSREIHNAIRPYLSTTAFDATEILVLRAPVELDGATEPPEVRLAERRMKVQLDGLTSLWVFCDRHWDTNARMLIPDWVYPGGQHQRILHGWWQRGPRGLFARFPMNDLGTRPPIDSDGYAHIRFSDLDIESYRMMVIGVAGEANDTGAV